MVEYNPKLKTLFKRDDYGVIMPHKVSSEAFHQVRPDSWIMTEKHDGRSVVFHAGIEEYFEYYGRTHASTFRNEEAEFMQEWAQTLTERNIINNKSVALYAELVGPGVNGNSHNLDDLELRFFDVQINGFWLNHEPMINVLKGFELDPLHWWTPWPGAGNINNVFLQEAADMERINKERYFEGVVAKTPVYMYDNLGSRIMWKLRHEDIQKLRKSTETIER